ncbi:MAG: sigma-70 family RNA polymerase sigma factor [Oscillospiraceae bacterium]|nr:sigma-70 family RNA polymerase sigma factor [Oscillospiraceae bacterium]
MEDAQIVQLYWERDEKAIPATADKYGACCARIARNIVGREEDAEECVNDVYLKAWNAMPPHRPNRLSAFLMKLTRNTAFNRYKRDRAKRRGGGETALVLDELAECVSGAETPEQALETRELAAAVNAFLDGLPEAQRAMFLSRYWYADSVAGIAACFGMKEGAVSTALYRLRGKLRRYLSERGFML